jgi:FkbM family methyltransferase
MKTVFDIGMYDGADTEYYLSEGHKVVAVEANPALVERAKARFPIELSSGQLVLVNAAVSMDSQQQVTLFISGDDLGSSSASMEQVASRNVIGSYSVSSVKVDELMKAHGVPYFMKVDIEGADKFCILPLTSQMRPDYISFEAGEDVEELVLHLKAIGYQRFKAISQCNFMELSNQEAFLFRLRRKIIHVLGYKDPEYVRCNGRFFRLMHSAGPAPWASDGTWCSAPALLDKWKEARNSAEFGGWFDIHAS